MKVLLKPDEAASFLGVSKWTIYKWVDEGRLMATKVGPGCLRIFFASVEALEEGNIIEESTPRAKDSGVEMKERAILHKNLHIFWHL